MTFALCARLSTSVITLPTLQSTAVYQYILLERGIGKTKARLTTRLCEGNGCGIIRPPAAIGSVVTTTILCWQTNYGFFKFYWVITKWILTIGLIIFGTFWLFPWGNTAEAIAQAEGLGAFKNSVYILM